MSEQNTSEPKTISSDSKSEPKTIASGSKVKDPRRVAEGKRLGAISKKAKEAKALRLQQQSDSYSSETNENTMYVVGGLVVVVVASYLLFTNKGKIVRTLTGDKKKSDPEPERESEPTPKKEISNSIFDD